MYSARRPLPTSVHVLPPSSVRHTPPQETAIVTHCELRGSTQMLWMPGKSYPPPPHCARSGIFHIDSTSAQVAPLSCDLKSPPGMVPHQRTPGSSAPPVSRLQTISS